MQVNSLNTHSYIGNNTDNSYLLLNVYDNTADKNITKKVSIHELGQSIAADLNLLTYDTNYDEVKLNSAGNNTYSSNSVNIIDSSNYATTSDLDNYVAIEDFSSYLADYDYITTDNLTFYLESAMADMPISGIITEEDYNYYVNGDNGGATLPLVEIIKSSYQYNDSNYYYIPYVDETNRLLVFNNSEGNVSEIDRLTSISCVDDNTSNAMVLYPVVTDGNGNLFYASSFEGYSDNDYSMHYYINQINQ